jgi:predicted ATPase
MVESTLRQMGSLPQAVYCWTPLLQSVIPELKGISLPDMVDLRRIKREVITEKTLELLVYLLREASKETPLVIILDNFQWMDTYSWRLLSVAAKALTSILFVVTGALLVEVCSNL